MSDGVFATIIVILFLLAFFFPSIVAYNRRHRNRFAISVLNLCVGWCGIGWIIALVWACTSNTEGRS